MLALSSFLSSLGWDASWAESFAPYACLVPGRVARVDRDRCGVLTEDGEVLADRQDDLPCTGDWVALRDLSARRLADWRGGP